MDFLKKKMKELMDDDDKKDKPSDKPSGTTCSNLSCALAYHLRRVT
jgi:hypothetical protein